MISGTAFTIQEPGFVRQALPLASRVATASEIEEIEAECAADNGTMCLACEDGMVVVQVQALATSLELFVRLAVAFRHGAFERQVAALLSIARELDAKTLAFGSRRRGWSRRLGPEWTRRGTDEFVRRVDG